MRSQRTLAAMVGTASAVVLALACASTARADGDGSRAATRACRAAEPRALLGSFISAFNAGSSWRLERIFAPAQSFKWYSTGGPGVRLAPVAYDRSTLIRYFADRHSWRERLTLTWFRSGGNSNGYAHFQFRLIRQARDLRPTPYRGKGALFCSSRGNMIAVWSMAQS